MPNILLATATVNDQANALGARLNGGFLDIYDGLRPASADTPVTTQVRLARLSFADPAFGAAADGVIVASSVGADPDAAATGIAAWFRCVTAGGDPVFDGDIGLSGSDMDISSVNIKLHASVSIPSFAYSASKD